jgi:hypothetical protein
MTPSVLWACHNAHDTGWSDLDLVILTVDKQRYLTDGWWVPGAVGQQAEVVRTHDWGPLTERRVVLQSGFEIEFGFAQSPWTQAPRASCATVACRYMIRRARSNRSSRRCATYRRVEER